MNDMVDNDRYAPPGKFRVRRIPVFDWFGAHRITVGDYPTLEAALLKKEELEAEENQRAHGRSNRLHVLYAVYDEFGIARYRPIDWRGLAERMRARIRNIRTHLFG